jgi:hypothetical protein
MKGFAKRKGLAHEWMPLNETVAYVGQKSVKLATSYDALAYGEAMQWIGTSTEKRFFVSHHKTGSTMIRDAVNRMNEHLRCSDANPHTCTTVFFNDIGVQEGFLAAWAQIKEANVLHVARNAFEAVVSEYAYDKVGAEPWMRRGYPASGECTCGWAQGHFCDGIRDVHNAIRARRLPFSKRGETYTEYINRLPEEDGLHATAIVMLRVSLHYMRTFHRQMTPYAAKTYKFQCESGFDDDTYAQCSARWNEGINFLGLGYESLGAKGVADAAAACAMSCPARHSDESSNRLTAYSDMATAVRRLKSLRSIDAQYLNGAIAEISQQVPCPMSQRYGGARAGEAVTARLHELHMKIGAGRMLTMDEEEDLPALYELKRLWSSDSEPLQETQMLQQDANLQP